MPLVAGDRLGHFEIVAPVGAGGMGEVYRARDPRLGRDVAIKVLPADVASDPARLRRFEHEARAAAALNHSNILALYDIGQDGGVTYMVTELLEGRTLRETLDDETLAISRVVDLAAQIADGLAAAHARNIVHRDIKPENLFVTADGRPKILDFGLAKIIEPGEAVDLPTRSATAPHTVLGTAGYMAPEQVRGQPVDHRADIFAFGAVLYEMLAGRRAFTGENALDTMSAILRQAPTTIVSTRERLLPPSLIRIVERCLEKTPAGRFQSTTDLAFALKSLLLSEAGAPVADLATGASGTSAWMRLLPWVFAAALGAVAVSLWWFGRTGTQAAPTDVMTFAVPEPPGARFAGAPIAPFAALSPDGRHLAFAAGAPDQQQQIWMRSLSGLDPRPLSGTAFSLEGGPHTAPMPFWSPDSQAIAFFADGKLKRIELNSGVVQTICDAPGNDGGTWGSDGTIIFADGNRVLQRVAARGGTPVALKFSDKRVGTQHRLPGFLPDGRRFLFQAAADGTTWVGSLDGDAPRQVLAAADSAATYAAPGFLLFVRQQALLVQRFDANRLAVEGEPMPIAEAVRTGGNGRAAFSVSSTGVLVYRPGEASDIVPLTWFNRQGTVLGTVPNSFARHSSPQMFPDERRVIVHIHDPEAKGGDVWTIDLETGARSRVTSDQGHDHTPVLSPDGREVIWSSNRLGRRTIFRKPSSGVGTEDVWLKTPERGAPTDWSRNWIVFDLNTDTQGTDIWYAPANDPGRARPYLSTSYSESNGRLSPDENWIAYESIDSGRPQVYVSSFPDPGVGKWAVSGTALAFSPRWRADGREIVHVGTSAEDPGRVKVRSTAVEMDLRPPRIHPPRVMFPVTLQIGATQAHSSNTLVVIPAKDGQRFFVNAAPVRASGEPLTLTVVVNWPALVAKR